MKVDRSRALLPGARWPHVLLLAPMTAFRRSWPTRNSFISAKVSAAAATPRVDAHLKRVEDGISQAHSRLHALTGRRVRGPLARGGWYRPAMDAPTSPRTSRSRARGGRSSRWPGSPGALQREVKLEDLDQIASPGSRPRAVWNRRRPTRRPTQGSDDDSKESLNGLAATATLALPGRLARSAEVAGMALATAFGWGTSPQTALGVALAFPFGFSLTVIALIRAGLAARTIGSAAWRRTRSRS